MTKVQCVILCGGLATRLRPLTVDLPKSLIPVKQHPFIAYQLKWLKRYGHVTEVVLCTGYKGEMIREAVGDGRELGLKVIYVDEGENLKGTGGALRQAYDEGVLDQQFLVMYGDSFLPIDFAPVLKTLGTSSAVMTVFKNNGQWDRSNVCFKEGRVTLYDKTLKTPSTDMQYIDYGLSAFSRAEIEREIAQGQKKDLAQVFHDLSVRGELAGFEVSERFYEIGSFQGLNDFSEWVGAHPEL